MEYRYKLEIELDEDKIKADGEYTVEQLRQYIINCFSDVGITNMIENGRTMTFIDNTYDFDFFARFGLVKTDLYYDEPWFRKYAKKMLWYNSGYGSEHCADSLKNFHQFELQHGN